MVPRDQFNRMAALALVAILLLLTFACRAYAAEITFMDSGPVGEQGQEEALEDFPEYPPEESPEEAPEKVGDEDPPDLPTSEIPEQPEQEEWEFLENDDEEFPDPPQDADTDTLLEEITKIRQLLEFLLYALIPLTCSVILVYKFCMWFYYTFIRTVL